MELGTGGGQQEGGARLEREWGEGGRRVAGAEQLAVEVEALMVVAVFG